MNPMEILQQMTALHLAALEVAVENNRINLPLCVATLLLELGLVGLVSAGRLDDVEWALVRRTAEGESLMHTLRNGQMQWPNPTTAWWREQARQAGKSLPAMLAPFCVEKSTESATP